MALKPFQTIRNALDPRDDRGSGTLIFHCFSNHLGGLSGLDKKGGEKGIRYYLRTKFQRKFSKSLNLQGVHDIESN